MGLHQRDAKGRAFLARYFGALEGAKIENVRMEDGDADLTDEEREEYAGFLDDQPWPTFDAVLPDGTRYVVQVSQDEEGNGPGFLFGLPTPEPSAKEKGHRN